MVQWIKRERNMRLSQLFTKTRKDTPTDETAKNAQLLIQAGFIHKEMAGIYAYMPLGKRVLDNITRIIREEMDKAGGQEVQMTVLQPKDIWEKTDRWDDEKVDNWFKTRLANGTELGVGLTHEEPIVDALKDYVSSYKDLPLLVYQVQSKFRNELRAKSGLLRGREFVMKDMYSFARSQKEHDEIYEKIAKVYAKVYDRLGIGDVTYRTYADGGIFTEKFSDEFQTVSEIGEDTIYIDKEKGVAINKEICTPGNLKKIGLNKEDLIEKRAVEVGNIFPLESKYSDALDLFYVDREGKRRSITMGCYGIGVSRLMGLLAEYFADERGLVWPQSIAPAEVYLARLGDDTKVVEAADELYGELSKKGIDVLYDDRDMRPGEKLADADLIGVPHRVVVSQKTVDVNKFEYKKRISKEAKLVNKNELIKILDSST